MKKSTQEIYRGWFDLNKEYIYHSIAFDISDKKEEKWIYFPIKKQKKSFKILPNSIEHLLIEDVISDNKGVIGMFIKHDEFPAISAEFKNCKTNTDVSRVIYKRYMDSIICSPELLKPRFKTGHKDMPLNLATSTIKGLGLDKNNETNTLVLKAVL